MTRNRIRNRTIVIVGASSGIGRGVAERAAARGARVVVFARRTEVLDDIVRGIRARGGRAVAVAGDVTDQADLERLALTAEAEFGRIDVWINNVGIGAVGLFWDVPIEDHARIIDANVVGLMRGSHIALGRFLEAGRGVLLNIGSVESVVPLAYQTSYAASKAAVLSLTRALRHEVRLAGHARTVRIGSVLPWAIATPWWVHAANYTGRAMRMPFMDRPGIVVRAILRAAADPVERMPVGPKARAAVIGHRLAPRLTTRVSADLAHYRTRRARPTATTSGAVHAPVAIGTEVRGPRAE